jgi:outer membrane protein with beta-barrel domain
MKRTHRLGTWTTFILLGLSAPASAQLLHQSHEWSHGTTLNIFAGTATDSVETGPVAGTSLGWEVTRVIAIEGSGYWLDRSGRSEAFAAALKLQAALIPPHTAVPFVTGGVGLYRASYENGAAEMPEFYRRRTSTTEHSPATITTFTDPSFVFGGGLNVFVTRHIAIRPDVESTIVVRDSASHIVTTVAVHLAYHFENPAPK